jgi:hypothetical protein
VLECWSGVVCVGWDGVGMGWSVVTNRPPNTNVRLKSGTGTYKRKGLLDSVLEWG